MSSTKAHTDGIEIIHEKPSLYEPITVAERRRLRTLWNEDRAADDQQRAGDRAEIPQAAQTGTTMPETVATAITKKPRFKNRLLKILKISPDNEISQTEDKKELIKPAIKKLGKAALFGVSLFGAYQLGAKYGTDGSAVDAESGLSWAKAAIEPFVQKLTHAHEVFASDEFQQMVNNPEEFQQMVEWSNANPERDLSEVYESEQFQSMARWIDTNPDRDIGELFASENFQNLVNNQQ